MTRGRAAVVGGWFLLIPFLACGEPTVPPRMTVGASLPAFTVPGLDGGEVSSRALGADGTITVLNFWATWCEPCRRELPELKALARDPGIDVVGIALDEEGASIVAPYVRQHGIDFTILLGNQTVFQRLGGLTIPYTLVLDDQRRVVSVHRGPIDAATIRQHLP